MGNFAIEITKRKKYGSVDVQDKQEYDISTTHNGYQWMTVHYTLDELVKLRDAVAEYIELEAADLG